jgi:hypothetical protein
MGMFLEEKVEILAGSRAGDRRKAAVRIEDLDAILRLPKLQAKPITAAPTVEQYNALLKDVQAVAKALDLVSKALQGKLRT